MTSIRRRTWAGPDGEERAAWVVDYRDAAGRRRSKQFARKKDADAWRVTAEHQVVTGTHTPDSESITVEKAGAQWLKGLRAMKDDPLEPTTIAAYDQHVRLHINPRLGAQRLSQLTAPAVRRFLDTLMKDLSRPMAVRVFRTFKALITDAQERGQVAQNVALAVKIRKAPRERSKATPPPKADLKAILSAAEKSKDAKARAIVELAIFTGMRASELRGLPWSNLDLREGTVRVEQRADAKGLIGPPKSGAGNRTISLPPRVVKVLKEWKLACPAHEADLVFPSAKGKPLSHHVLTKFHVAPLLKAAGVPHYGMHSFRHAAASLWIEQGLNPKRVQTLMGHKSIQVTFDTYGHLFEQRDRDASDAAAIERALFGDAT